MKIVITDLTRFNNQDIVCTAGVEPGTYRCVRPMPYFKYGDCRKRGLIPGAILSGKFRSDPQARPPHVEDSVCAFDALELMQPATSEEFRDVLDGTRVNSINAGFGGSVPVGLRVVAAANPPACSIITIALQPQSVEVVDDAYDPEKVKLHISDDGGREYRYVPITDLGFHHMAVREAHSAGRARKINDYLRKQEVIYLRIGLSRYYAQPNSSKAGFWIQANGIYSFPDYRKDLRTYP